MKIDLDLRRDMTYTSVTTLPGGGYSVSGVWSLSDGVITLLNKSKVIDGRPTAIKGTAADILSVDADPKSFA